MHRTRSQPHAGAAQYWILGVAILSLSILGFVGWFMKPHYPEVTSPDNLTLMRALYTACSSQNLERLDRVDRAVTKTYASGNMTQPERDSFAGIIAQARGGDWHAAAQASYRFAEDQVR